MTPGFSRLGQRLGKLVFALGFVGAVLPAWADMWGYIDGQGVAHFSSDKLDERYQLFFKTGESFSAGGGAALPLSPQPAGSPSPIDGGRSQARLIAFFEVSPGYKAVKHLIKDASVLHGIDYELLQALIAAESGYDPQAVSPKGAVGLMQLMPPTAERYGVKADSRTPLAQKLTDPKTNIRAGSSYLRDLIKMFPGQLDLAVAAYNAGEGAVQRAGNKIPNYPETKNYVKTVMQMYSYLKPPAAVQESRSSTRVRMEMMGGAPGRSNMPAPLALKPQALPGASRANSGVNADVNSGPDAPAAARLFPTDF